MCEVLTKSGHSFMYKIIREIISMPRVDSGYPHKFMVNSWVFKDGESETGAKTNSRHRVCLQSTLGMESTCTESALGTLCQNTHTHTHTHTHTSPPRADPNFLTHLTAKGGPSIFEWSTLSM